MKYLAIFIVLIAAHNGNCQTNPHAWARDQRSRSHQQDNSNEVFVNTDRLTSSLEHRILEIIRAENTAVTQQLVNLERSNARLEDVINSLRHDVTDLKPLLEAIRDETRQSDDLSLLSDSEDRTQISGSLNEKLENLAISINEVRSTVTKLERGLVNMRKNTRSGNNGRHQQPPFGLIATRSDSSERSFCTIDDPNQESGIRNVRKNFYAFCEMDRDTNVGWIVIQNRVDGQLDFFRTWNEYKEGFGNIAGEFWLGLEKIHELTSSKLHELRIEMEDFEGKLKFAEYPAFAISDESNFFTLSVLAKGTGNAGDSLKYHGGMKFSTFDNDNDAWIEGNCARSHFGGWWYNSCDESNLNGRYFERGIVPEANNYQGIYWSSINGSMSSLKSVRMMIRPVDF